MTGVFTKTSFELDCRRMARKQSCGIIAVDLNNLKGINDSKGHQEGDRIICLAAAILSRSLPRKSRVYRVGGDEFVILLRSVEKKDVEGQVKFLRENLERAECSAALGYCMYRKGQLSMEEAIKIADRGMYIDKAKYKAKQ